VGAFYFGFNMKKPTGIQWVNFEAEEEGFEPPEV
tara:strand:- start:9 stop:110 length:102 start_codon:yes stop_codon:yes gene_type:complete